ncbi:hypothetical protein KC367_g125 [Hortaea werneckii]|nr:hypothetical protein KC367_g125 [Hortaea werneckii]
MPMCISSVSLDIHPLASALSLTSHRPRHRFGFPGLGWMLRKKVVNAFGHRRKRKGHCANRAEICVATLVINIHPLRRIPEGSAAPDAVLQYEVGIFLNVAQRTVDFGYRNTMSCYFYVNYFIVRLLRTHFGIASLSRNTVQSMGIESFKSYRWLNCERQRDAIPLSIVQS